MKSYKIFLTPDTFVILSAESMQIGPIGDSSLSFYNNVELVAHFTHGRYCGVVVIDSAVSTTTV